MQLKTIIATFLFFITTSAFAYFCPPAGSIYCQNGHCQAESENGTWIGISDSPAMQFKNIVSHDRKISCYYSNEAGADFKMENIYLNHYDLQPGSGPWTYDSPTHSWTCHFLFCEFVTDPKK